MSDYRLVDKNGLKTIYGIPYSHQHIVRLEKAGKFPRRIQLGPCRVAPRQSGAFHTGFGIFVGAAGLSPRGSIAKKPSAWYCSAVEAWIGSLAPANDESDAP